MVIQSFVDGQNRTGAISDAELNWRDFGYAELKCLLGEEALFNQDGIHDYSSVVISREAKVLKIQ